MRPRRPQRTEREITSAMTSSSSQTLVKLLRRVGYCDADANANCRVRTSLSARVGRNKRSALRRCSARSALLACGMPNGRRALVLDGCWFDMNGAMRFAYCALRLSLKQSFLRRHHQGHEVRALDCRSCRASVAAALMLEEPRVKRGASKHEGDVARSRLSPSRVGSLIHLSNSPSQRTAACRGG